MNKLQIMSDIDTVDHITVLFRKNRPVDRAKAVATVKHCKAFYPGLFEYGVNDARRLENADISDIVKELTEIREKLMSVCFD